MTEDIAYRIVLAQGNRRKRILITQGAKPYEGQVVVVEGHDWEVIKVTEEKILAIFEHQPEGGLRLVAHAAEGGKWA